jgi:hypothetical protein
VTQAEKMSISMVQELSHFTCPSTVIARISSPGWFWSATLFGTRWKQSGTRGKTPDLTTFIEKNKPFI